MTDHHLVFKTELHPNNVQRSALQSHFGAARFAYNCLLNWTVEEYDKHRDDPSYPKPSLSQQSLQKVWTNQLREQFAPWYAQNSRDPYRHAAASLAKAYQGFFRASKGEGVGAIAAGHPAFKRRGSMGSYATDGAQLRNSGHSVYAPRIGEVRLHERLKAADWLLRMGATLQDATLSQEATGRIFISLRLRADDGLALAFFRGKFQRKGEGLVGIDLGLKEYATLSDGTVVNNPRYYRNLEAKLARSQRSLSTKKLARRKRNGQRKGDNADGGYASKSEEHAKAKVARVNARVRHQRREFLNKLARELVAQHKTICIEDLNVEAMKEKLGKSVSDASPAEFRRILTYMADRYGTTLVVADRYFPSSKTCSACGEVKAKLPLSKRTYECHECGLTMDRDFNAAINLKAWARDYLAKQDAARCAESLNGRGPSDLIALDQSQRKAADSRHQTANASHGHKAKNSMTTALMSA